MSGDAHLESLLREVLPFIGDPNLARRVRDAIGDEVDEEPGPTWLAAADGADLMMMGASQFGRLGLEGFDPATVLATVGRRIDQFLNQPAERVAYPVEEWLKMQVQQQPSRRRGPKTSPRKRADRVNDFPVDPAVASFAQNVVRLLRAPKNGAIARILPRAVTEHDTQRDPDGSLAMRRIADAMIADGAPVTGVRRYDSGVAVLTWVDVGNRDHATVVFNSATQSFTFDTLRSALKEAL